MSSGLQNLLKAIPLGIVLLTSLLATLALTTTPALATPPLQFGGPGEEAGQINGGESVAVDNCANLGVACTTIEDPTVGDVYVADYNNQRVDKVGPNGEFLLAWGWGVANGNEELQTCTSECRAGKPGPGAGQLEDPSGVAVDDSGGLSQGDVYVEERFAHRGEKFAPDGNFILMFGRDVNKTTAGDVCRAGEECQDGSEGEEPGELERLEPNSIAVGASGVVYVGDVSRVQEFSEAGAYLRTVAVGNPEEHVRGVRVDEAGHLYVTLADQSGVHEFEGCASSCTGVELGDREPGASGSSTRFALGPTGELFVDLEDGRLSEFAPTGNELESFPGPTLPLPKGVVFDEGLGGLLVLAEDQLELAAVPPSGPLVEGQQATAEPAGAAALKATFDPEGQVENPSEESHFHFEYDTSPYAEGEGPHGTSTPVEPSTGGNFESRTVPAQQVKGLEPSREYHFRVVAENAEGETTDGLDQTFTTDPALQIESESVSKVSATSALLAGDINPLGSETHYAFSYGPTSACGGTECTVPAGEGNAGSGTSTVPVSVLIEGLSPGTTYHYRLVAHNALAPTEGIAGPEHTFTTQSGGSGTGLIDGRSWEMVSPPQKHGASLEMPDEEGGVVQASEDGSRLTYFAFAPITSEAAGNRSFAYTQLLSSRTGTDTWDTEDLTTREESIQGLPPGKLTEYELFSPDLSAGVVEPRGATPLSALTTERTPYVRNDTSGEYEPLVTAANVPAGTKFGGEEIESQPVTAPGAGGASFEGGVEFVTGSPDLSHVLLASPVALTAGFKPGFQGSEEHASLYEWSEGKTSSEAGTLQAVSLIPPAGADSCGGTAPVCAPAAEAGMRSAVGAGSDSATKRRLGELVRNAVSTDGSRVVFETGNGSGTQHLYLRDVTLGQTVQLDVPGEGIVGATGSENPQFVDASSDGSRIFFTDSQRLTQAATIPGPGQSNLYMCDIPVAAPGGQLECKLKYLAGEVQGVDLGVNTTGTYVYYVAGSPGAPDLYMHDVVGGETRLIAALSPADFPDWLGIEEIDHDLGDLTARVSGNGRFVAFMSQQSLTGYDNRDAISGVADEEVFLYERERNTLSCVSCDPSGARPHGVYDPEDDGPAFRQGDLPLLVDRPEVWGNRWLAGSLPGFPKVDVGHALYEPRNLDNDGRLFFDSADALVPGDANGKEDVYEYEPEGVGPESAPCGPSTGNGREVYRPAGTYEAGGTSGEEGAGCVGLISSGTSNEESAFMDASGMGPGGEEGEDVFFMTSAKLAPQDVDTALDVYDAHTCSAVAPCAPSTVDVPPACNTTDSCRTAPPPQPEVFGAPASATFHGPGNQTPSKTVVPPKKAAPKCRKGFVRKTVKHKSECVRFKKKSKKK